jgi:hypothetical protein
VHEAIKARANICPAQQSHALPVALKNPFSRMAEEAGKSRKFSYSLGWRFPFELYIIHMNNIKHLLSSATFGIL